MLFVHTAAVPAAGSLMEFRGLRLLPSVTKRREHHRAGAAVDLGLRTGRYSTHEPRFAPAGNSRMLQSARSEAAPQALIGSANFAWGGMVANREIGMLVEG
jgi:hypothetical protein